MDWHAIHEYAEATELWTTIVVNLTGIFTVLIVAGRWLARRVVPDIPTVILSVTLSLILSIAAAIVLAWGSVVTHGLFGI